MASYADTKQPADTSHTLGVSAGEPGDLNNDPEAAAGDEQANQDELHEIEDNFDQDEIAAQQAAVQADQEIQQQLNNWVGDPAVELAQLPPNGANNPQEVVPAGAGIEVLVEQVAALRQQIQEMQEGPIVAGVRCRYLLTAAKILSPIAGAISLYFALKRTIEGDQSKLRSTLVATTASPVPTPDPQASQVIYKNWLGASETDFWETMALFVEKNKPRSFKEQLLFMQFTEDLAQHLMKAPFTWQSANDKCAQVNSLAQTLQSQGAAATYRQLKTLTYQSKPLPRAICANLMAHALVVWWSNNA